MALTKLQKRLVQTIKHSGMDAKRASVILTGLETEQQQWAMLDWMDAYYDETGAYPTEGPIAAALSKILEKFPKTKAA